MSITYVNNAKFQVHNMNHPEWRMLLTSQQCRLVTSWLTSYNTNDGTRFDVFIRSVARVSALSIFDSWCRVLRIIDEPRSWYHRIAVTIQLRAKMIALSHGEWGVTVYSKQAIRLPLPADYTLNYSVTCITLQQKQLSLSYIHTYVYCVAATLLDSRIT